MKLGNKTYDNLAWIMVVAFLVSITVLINYTWGRYVYLLILILVFGIYTLRRRGRIRVKLDAFQGFRLAFAAYAAYSGLWALSMSDSITMSKTLLSIVLCYYPIYAYYRDYGKTEDLVSAVKWGGIVSSIYAIQFYGLRNIMLAGQAARTRLENSFANVNSLGLFAAVAIMIQCWQLLYGKGKKWEVLGCIPAVLVLSATQGRKAFLFAVLAVVMLLLLKSSNQKKIINSIIAVFAGILVIAALLYALSKVEMFAGVLERFQRMFNTYTGIGRVDRSTIIRDEMKKLGIEWWLKSPIVGVGIANPHILAGWYLGHDAYLHNNYAELLCGGGIIGICLFYAQHIYCIVHLYRLRDTDRVVYSLMITWILLMLVMDYGKVSYSSKIDNLYLMLIFLAVEEMKRKKRCGYTAASKNRGIIDEG